MSHRLSVLEQKVKDLETKIEKTSVDSITKRLDEFEKEYKEITDTLKKLVD